MNKVTRSDGRIPIKKGLWCPLRKMYFPQIFAFVGGDPPEDDTPISCLYTLDPRAVSLIEGVGIVPIDRIDETCQRNNRAKSLILRHHETLSKALGYVDGIEDLTNTPDKAQLYMTRAGIFTLMQRPTQSEWPSPMIFYIAEARDEDTRRFEVAVGSDGKLERQTCWETTKMSSINQLVIYIYIASDMFLRKSRLMGTPRQLANLG